MSEKRVILLEPDDAFLAKKQRIAEKLKAVSKPPKAARKKKTGIIAKFKKDVASAAASSHRTACAARPGFPHTQGYRC